MPVPKSPTWRFEVSGSGWGPDDSDVGDLWVKLEKDHFKRCSTNTCVLVSFSSYWIIRILTLKNWEHGYSSRNYISQSSLQLNAVM